MKKFIGVFLFFSICSCSEQKEVKAKVYYQNGDVEIIKCKVEKYGGIQMDEGCLMFWKDNKAFIQRCGVRKYEVITK